MRINFKLLLMVALLAGTMASANDTLNRYTVWTGKPFEDVVENLKFAISEHNFRLTGQNRIGKAIGERERIVFPRASVFEFCNLKYGQKILELDWSYLLHMPCRIVVYDQGERIVVEAQLLPENDRGNDRVIIEVNQIIKAIVRYAAE